MLNQGIMENLKSLSALAKKNSVSNVCAETRGIANFDVKSISEHFKAYFVVVAGNLMAKLSKLLNKYNSNSETYLTGM